MGAQPGRLPYKPLTEWMKTIAKLRADAANQRRTEGMRARERCIAKGQGAVHGIQYDLEEQIGFNLNAA